MKQKYLILGGLLITSQLLQSCVEAEDLYNEKKVEATYTELGLTIGGECSLTEKPMTKADGDGKEIYGISVAMLIPSSTAGAAPTQKPFAYGIFDNIKPENLKLNVIDGFEYRISCTMIKEGKDSILTNAGTLAPMAIAKSPKEILGTITNKFVTTEQPDGTQKFLYDLDSPRIGTPGQNTCMRPFIKRYHGVIDKLTAKADQSNTLEIYRRYFGVKFKQDGLQSNCKLEIQIEGAPVIWLTPQQKESPDLMVSMKTLTTAVEAGKILIDNARVKVTVHRTGQAPVMILNYNVGFKRNYMHTIIITDIDHFGTGSNISIKVENEELLNNAQEDLPWQGGK